MNTELTQLHWFIFYKSCETAKVTSLCDPFNCPEGTPYTPGQPADVLSSVFAFVLKSHLMCASLWAAIWNTPQKLGNLFFLSGLWEALSDWPERWNGRGQCVKVGRACLVWGWKTLQPVLRGTWRHDNSQNEGDRALCTEDGICRRCGQTKSFTSF